MKSERTIRPAVLSVVAVYVTTSAHHLYGAWLYDTPWRTHIATSGFFWLSASLLLIAAYARWKRTWLAWGFALVAGFFFVGAIGLYEGFYNHVLKNTLYFSGVSVEQLLALYPPPKYELPNDLLFEATGILTFFVCAWCGREIVVFLKRKP